MGSVDYGVRSVDLVCSGTGSLDYDMIHMNYVIGSGVGYVARPWILFLPWIEKRIP